MTRLFKEMEKGAGYERGLVFGREQNGVPGEAHFWEDAVNARGPTEQRRHFDPSYDPGRVDGLGNVDPNAARAERGGSSSSVRRDSSFCPKGQEVYQDSDGTNLCRYPDGVNPNDSLAAGMGLGEYPLTVDTIQKTFMSHRDFVPSTQSGLSPAAQHFSQGLVRPEGREAGQHVLDETGATARLRRLPGGRLRADVRPPRTIRATVTEIGELEPRMGVWGHELSDRARQWFSPPGPRKIAKGDRVVATQTLRGLGDIAGGLGGIETSYQVAPDQKSALAKGYGQLFYQGGAIGITTPHGPITIVDAQTVYPTMQEALKRGFGVLDQQGSQIVVSGPAGPTPINSPKTAAPPPAPTPVAQLAPPPKQPGGVFVPPPPAAGTPPLPSGGSLTNPLAPLVAPPGTILQTPAGTKIVDPTLALSPAPAPSAGSTGAGGSTSSGSTPTSTSPTSSGSSGSGGGYGSDSSVSTTDTTPAPSGPLAFLTKPINIPVVGQVPTWVPLGLAAYFFWSRRKKNSTPSTNPKGKKNKSR